MKLTMVLLTGSLILTGCGKNDFCLVVPGPKLFDPETSKVMVQTDRPDVEQIAVENEYGKRNCGW